MTRAEYPVPQHNFVTPAADVASFYVDREWTINWPLVIKRRPMLLEHTQGMPPYLLLPEVEWILEAAYNDSTNLMIDTLWHTGARISELLALTPKHFIEDEENGVAWASLYTLKQRKAGRPANSTKNERSVKRLVDIADPSYMRKVKRYVASHGVRPNDRLFPFTRQTANNRIKAVAKNVEGLPFLPTAHTFRHSFAINCVLHGAYLKALQKWLGHRHAETTEIYTEVLGTETSHFMRPVRFSQTDPMTLVIDQVS